MNWHDPAWVGAIGQWVGAIASFAAAFVALWIALDAKRAERKREERENRPHLVITELKWSVDDTIRGLPMVGTGATRSRETVETRGMRGKVNLITDGLKRGEIPLLLDGRQTALSPR